MAVYQVGLVLEISTPQKAAAIRDKLANYIANDPDVDLLSWSTAKDTRRFLVVGVDVSTSSPFEQEVEADNEAAARTMFSAPHIIAAVSEVE